MSGIRLSLLISLSESYLLAAIALASSMLVARILTPEEIGIYSVSVAVLAVAQVLRDFGIGSFIVQAQQLTDDIIRTAFGLSLVVGTTLFALVFLAAPHAATFYDEPRLYGTLVISAINFLILPFCSISMSILKREMQFKRIALINVTAAICTGLVVVGAGMLDAGPKSMAIGAVANSIITAVGTWLARADHRFLAPGFSEWRSLVRFGGQAAAASTITSIALSANDLIVGKVLGFGPVALISRAQGLMNLFHRDLMNAIRNVAFPAFARAKRDGEAAQLEARYTYSVTSLSAFAWPFYGLLAVFPLEILRLLFGAQWDAAAPMIPIFAAAGAISATMNLTQPLMIAIGRIDLVTRAEFIVQPARIAAIAFAAIWFKSAFACAVAYLLIIACAVPVFYRAKEHALPTDFSMLLRGLLISAAVTAIALLPALAAVALMRTGTATALPLLPFLATIGLCAVAWLCAIHLLSHPISRDSGYVRIQSTIFGRVASRLKTSAVEENHQ
ncbi:MAG: oligosaccharide flippase family protein [Zoogloeaceae bacterium]|uniref:oligosaccharide flippase family protein n=1 Tax=Denitromonas sp. TaxID=2734609 RepID=UPI002BA2CB95|nr:oligosaccharide flippase family protein [Zoogloeaceae bacterium]HQU87696.1 oligosaccharide flippase family protein [Denitromonas sp.]